MLRPFLLVVGLVPLVGVGVPAALGADNDPKDIIAKAIKAHGGEEFLTKYQAGRVKNKGTIDIPGVGEVEFTQEVAFMLPDKGKDELEMTIAGQKVTVRALFNGDKASLEVNGKAMDIGDEVKGALKNAGHVMKIGRLVPLLKEKGFELSSAGEDKVDGKEVVGVHVVTKGQKDVNLYFDKKTHLLTKVEFRGIDTTGKEITEQRLITEYGKNKDGIAVPKKVTIKHDDKKFIEVEVLEVTNLEKIDESEFKK